MNSTEIVYIYGLFDGRFPTDIRYIGYTIEPKNRLAKHKRESKKLIYHRHKWINKVLNDGGTIKMKIIKIVPLKKASEEEINTIRKYKSMNHNLTNGNEGGKGGIAPTEEIREKIRISKLGNKWNIGRKHSKEFSEKLSQRLKGIKKSEEHKRKLSLSHLGKRNLNLKSRVLSDEIIIKMYAICNSGLSPYKTAKQLKINKSLVKNIMYNNNYYRDIKEKYNLIWEKKNGNK